jgi:hypothetical protein
MKAILSLRINSVVFTYKFVALYAGAALCLVSCALRLNAQNIFSGEPVQVVGSFNGYVTEPYGLDYRTTSYRRISTNTGFPTDGRGQWATTINVQNLGGDVLPVNMPGGPGNGFLFISGPNSNRFLNKWVFSDVAQGTVDEVNVATCYNCGNDMGLDMSIPGHYTFVFNDCGYTATNARYYVGRTTNAPAQPSRSSETVNNDGSITIGISLDAPLSPEENVYVRYTTAAGPDFSGPGSGVVQATGAGLNYTVVTPIFPDGTVIWYYIFSSTRSLLQLILDIILNALLAILRFDDNNGDNYTTTAQLPVEMTTFTARPEGSFIRLQWSTATEVNNDYFDIERSADGRVFEKIGHVKGASESLTEKSYEFIDKNPLAGSNYYRLRQVDFDGTAAYSPIVSADILMKDHIVLYPNPANNFMTISGLAENTAYTIKSAFGMTLLSGTTTTGQPVDISTLPPGCYVWQGGNQSVRFVKQ